MSASQDARQVLLEISLLAGGATQNLNASRGGGDAIGPGGDGRHMLIYWRKEFASACWGELPALVERARAELDGFKRGKGPGDASDPEAARRDQMLEEGEGYSVDDVARKFSYSVSLIRKWRVADGRDAEWGRPADHREDRVDDTLDRALSMRADGMSLRAIELATGVKRTTIAYHAQKRS